MKNRIIGCLFLLTVLFITIGAISATNVTEETITATESPLTSTAEQVNTQPALLQNNEKDNKDNGIITQENYDNFFDEYGIFKNEMAENRTKFDVSGNITGKDFIFYDVDLTLGNDGTSKLYNCTLTTVGDSKITLNGIIIDNIDLKAIDFGSAGNTINNSCIKVVSQEEMRVVEFTGANNTIINTKIDATIPAINIPYDKDNVGQPKSSGLYIKSNNNYVDNVTITVDGQNEIFNQSYASISALDIQSISKKIVIQNNVINNTRVNITGSKYVYGVNVGRTNNTLIDNIEVNINSKYYCDAIQLFDANNIQITGNLNSNATVEAYGVYSTAMAVGTSNNITLTDLNINTSASKSNAVLLEGSSNILIENSEYNVTGATTMAVDAHVDWMKNKPYNITIINNNFTLSGTEDNNVLYFGLCDKINIINNTIKSDKGSEINLNNTGNAEVSGNYIKINDVIFGNFAVISTEKANIIKDNTPTSKVMEDMQKQIEELEKQIEELTKAKNTTITLNNISTAKYNDNITISGMLINEDSVSLSSQTVTVTIGEEKINLTTVNGLFNHTFNIKSIGKQKITVTYDGNTKYNPTQSETTFYVQKKPVLYFYNTENTTEDETITVTGKLLNNGKAITGSTITLNVNDKNVTVTPNKDGYFKYSFKAIAGENIVTATYAGTTEYAEVNATTNIHAMMKTTLYAYKIENANTQDTIKVSGKLLNKGKGIEAQTVTIKINSKTYTATTNKEGYFQYNLKVNNAGRNNLTVTFDGNKDYLKAQYTSTFTTKNKTKIYTYKLDDTTVGKTSKISGKLLSNNKPLTDKEIIITVNGEKYTATSNKEGYFQLDYKATKTGTYNVNVSYEGDDENYMAIYNTTLTIKK